MMANNGTHATDLQTAMVEARRFLTIAQAAMDESLGDRWANKQSAAAKRASMDLTRALADFRGRGRR